jgi:hypothetical protein
LDEEIRAPLEFPLKPEDIQSWNYRDEALKFGVTVQDPPSETIEDHKYLVTQYLDIGPADITRFGQIDIEVPAGYFIGETTGSPRLQAHLALWPDKGGEASFTVYGAIQETSSSEETRNWKLSSLLQKSGRISVLFSYRYVSMAGLDVSLTYQLTKEAREKWKFAVWAEIRAAAEARHREQQARLQQERDELWRLLNGKDTLTLRRLEREELVRLVMQWLLGPDYPLVSSPEKLGSHPPGNLTLIKLFTNELAFQITPLDPSSPSFNPTFRGVTGAEWYDAIQFGEFVKFVHQAIEWENLLYFLYPYFWGSESVAKDKILFEHSDPEHERYLRAGYARVVLTVRPGFEKTFTELMEMGSLKQHSSTRYMTIAEEISNFARTNYSGIPPANPELHARPLLFPKQRKTWDIMQMLMAAIEAFQKEKGFYPEKLDDVPLPPDISSWRDAWGKPFVYSQPGLGADYDLVSLGEDNAIGGEGINADISSNAGASLVGTWFDYTPTSALDIEVGTNADNIS